jgi:hypothetical protein
MVGYIMNESVVQEWLSKLSMKQQTVLLAAFRGCDGLPKTDPSKHFTKLMRGSILKNADGCSTFFPKDFDSNVEEGNELIDDFFIDCSRGGMDQYPVHWLLHFIQAAEIIGYKCPHKAIAKYWKYFYFTAVKAMHLYPETEVQLDSRLKDNICDKKHDC